MKKYLLLLSLITLFSCKKETVTTATVERKPFTGLEIDTILQDDISIRALGIDNNKVWYAGTNGKYGYQDLINDKNFQGVIAKDSSHFEFRALALTSSHFFILNIGNPAQLHKISKDGKHNELVYLERHEKVFYDCIKFWNDKDGIAMGDPTENCLSILLTSDGGSTWHKIPCNVLPQIDPREAAFAASNTNIVVKGNKAWIVTGGKKARVFYSPDKGKTWSVFETPIVQGRTMTGIFTADFYDEKNGIIAGGDYDTPMQNHKNKAITQDGGKTWKLVAENKGFGYASCVQYVPNSNAKQLVSVGTDGLYYSKDAGENWQQLSKDKDLYTIQFQNDSTAFAAGKNKVIRIRFK